MCGRFTLASDTETMIANLFRFRDADELVTAL